MLVNVALRACRLAQVDLAFMCGAPRLGGLTERAPFARIHNLGFPIELELRSTLKFLKARSALATLLARHVVCVSFSWPAAFRSALSAAKRSALVWFCQESLNIPLSAKRSAALALMRMRGTHIVCPSISIQRQLLRAHYPSDQLTVIQNGVDTEHFSPVEHSAPAREALGTQLKIKIGDLVVVCIARLDGNKNQRVLIEATAIARRSGIPVSLICVGEEHSAGRTARDDLAQFARTHAVEQFVRFIPQQSDVRPWLAFADAIALSSLQEAAAPLALLEAAAMAKPILASGIDGVKELVDDELTGLLFSPTNPANCADKIMRLAADCTLRNALGQRAWEKCLAKFSIDRVTREWDNFLYRVVHLSTAPA